MSYQLTKPVQGRSGSPRDSFGEGMGEEPTYDELYEEARKRGLKGRSKMSKTELERALGR